MTRGLKFRYLEELPGQPQTQKVAQVLSQDGHAEIGPVYFQKQGNDCSGSGRALFLGDGNGSAAGVRGSGLRKASHGGHHIAALRSLLSPTPPPALSVPRLPLKAL